MRSDGQTASFVLLAGCSSPRFIARYGIMLSTGTKVDRNQPRSAGIIAYIGPIKRRAMNAPMKHVAFIRSPIRRAATERLESVAVPSAGAFQQRQTGW